MHHCSFPKGLQNYYAKPNIKSAQLIIKALRQYLLSLTKYSKTNKYQMP